MSYQERRSLPGLPLRYRRDPIQADAPGVEFEISQGQEMEVGAAQDQYQQFEEFVGVLWKKLMASPSIDASYKEWILCMVWLLSCRRFVRSPKFLLGSTGPESMQLLVDTSERERSLGEAARPFAGDGASPGGPVRRAPSPCGGPRPTFERLPFKGSAVGSSRRNSGRAVLPRDLGNGQVAPLGVPDARRGREGRGIEICRGSGTYLYISGQG